LPNTASRTVRLVSVVFATSLCVQFTPLDNDNWTASDITTHRNQLTIKDGEVSKVQRRAEVAEREVNQVQFVVFTCGC
jgi:hypothetical protein